MNKSDKFYNKLLNQLKLTSSWPNSYLFKFIIKSNFTNSNDLRNIFNDLNPEISLKSSKIINIQVFQLKFLLILLKKLLRDIKRLGIKSKE